MTESPRDDGPRSMQLHLRLGAAEEAAGERAEEGPAAAVQRVFVHLVERAVHEAGGKTLDEEVLAEEEPHEAADGAVLAERDQRAEIPVGERQGRLAGEPAAELLQEVRGLLVRGLGARRHRRLVARARAGGAVADREDVG